MQEKQYKILNEVIKLVPFDGWTDSTLRDATQKCGLPQHYEKIAFKAGVIDAIALFHEKIDTETYTKIDKNTLKSLKVRDKIFHILDNRLEIMAQYKPVIRKTLQYLSQPQNICISTKMLWEMADKTWYAAGDTASDFNYYTKRTTLMAVYSSTLLFWLQDESENHINTSKFLKRRIENIMQFENVKRKIASFMPNFGMSHK